ncbi:unnamed protein product [Chrysoparadoxa australica]
MLIHLISGVKGALAVTIHNARNLKNAEVAEVTSPLPYIQLEVEGGTRLRSSVASGSEPVFDETLQFPELTRDDSLTVMVVNRSSTGGSDVVVGQCIIKATEWGKAGVPSLGWFQVMTKQNTFGGEVQLGLLWTPSLKLRAPLSLVVTAAEATASITKPADPVIESGLSLIGKAVSPIASGVGTVLGGMTHMHKIVAAAALALSLAAGVGTFAVMALIFLPVTLFGGFVSAVAAFFLVPPCLVLSFLLASSVPFRLARKHTWAPGSRLALFPHVPLACCSLSSHSPGCSLSSLSVTRCHTGHGGPPGRMPSRAAVRPQVTPLHPGTDIEGTWLLH